MENVLARYAFSPADWFDLGRSLQGEHSMLHAGLCFKAAVESDHGFFDAWVNLSWCQQELGLLEAAKRSLHHALALSPQSDLAQGKMVQLLMAQGLEAEAGRMLWAMGKFRRQHSR